MAQRSKRVRKQNRRTKDEEEDDKALEMASTILQEVIMKNNTSKLTFDEAYMCFAFVAEQYIVKACKDKKIAHDEIIKEYYDELKKNERINPSIVLRKLFTKYDLCFNTWL